ncbi:MAG: polysaccharide biosynthesis/export family protein [Paludibacteraceae bacterium]|nr:polysaccharide biosynthesis/export family protein [Paludibacteraceae bacterium]
MHTQIRSCKIRILAFLAVLLGTTSCITNKTLNLMQDSDKLPQYTKAEYQYYRLMPNDQLMMRVLTLNDEAAAMYNSENQNNQRNSISSFSNYRIYDDGTVDLPFADHIQVAGLTLREAEAAITEALRPMIPDVMVKLALANDQFYFVGEGNTGTYSIYKERLNIFQALALVGNFKYNGDRRRVRIIRPNHDGGHPIVKEFDLRSASIIDSEFYYVYPNDVIYLSSIKGDFWKIQDYNAIIGTLSTSINFLVSVINLGLSF